MLYKIVILILLLVSSLFTASPVHAAVSLPWLSTYNCADWTQGSALSCDGLTTYGGWTTLNGSQGQITALANFSGGAGGRGQRQWNGDGQNNNSGGLQISFTSSQTEIWVRWYMRWEQGYTWNPLGYDKLFWLPNGYWGFEGSDKIYFHNNNPGYDYVSPAGLGWDTLMVNGGSDVWGNGETHKTSDGQWHLFEFHLKTDTNGSNGVFQVWIDQMQKANVTNVNYGGLGFQSIGIGANQNNPNNGRDVYVDHDDIAISNTGYIGPISTKGFNRNRNRMDGFNEGFQ